MHPVFRFVLAAVISVAALVSALAQPRLTVSTERVDLGILYNGARKSADVRLINAGSDTLQILNVQSSCGCTTTKQPKSRLAPGESDVLTVEFNSTGFRGPATKYVTLTTNSPITPTVMITLAADIREELELVGSPVVWAGSLGVGKESTQQITLKNTTGRSISIVKVVSPSRSIAVFPATLTIGAGKEATLTVRIIPEREGYLNEMLMLETDSKNQTRVPVRVSFIGVKPG